ncbi:MAG TPA: mycofactocin-coupled SDR family oxidoreductase [Acidimicrobiales bacterium]|nr:mycofactocin-coupled SDR family oxidoreductase [Acidimicrobiales bacterium]
MPGRMEGKVAFITGAGRGQGRSHAVRLAQEGADIIAVDICEDIATNPYPMSSAEDLAQTVKEVEALDRRIVARKADVRDREQLRSALAEGVAELGHLDVLVANAGICPLNTPGIQPFVDAFDVDFIGVVNAVNVSLPHLGSGSSIVITGSTAGMMEGAVDNPELGAGGAGYGLAKKLLITYTEALALQTARDFVRVNCIHPTNCNTHLLHQEAIYKSFRPDLENPTREDAEQAFVVFQAMPIPYIEPIDISNQVLFFASDESRYVTGLNVRVDAGSLLKTPHIG